MHNMKENYNHGCYYKINRFPTFYGAWYKILLFANDFGIIAIKMVEIYKEDKPEIKREKEQRINDIVECFENLIQMNDYQLCKWLSSNAKHFENCKIKESGLQSNEEYDYIIGTYKIKVSPEHQDDAFI